MTGNPFMEVIAGWFVFHLTNCPNFLGGDFLKRFISFFLLCVILPFLLLRPLSSNAIDVQGREYADPSLLPIDVNFSDYDYYFLTVSGSISNPTYLFYFIKDNSETSSNLYFTVTLSGSQTYLRNGPFTSFGTITNYSISRYSYNGLSGTWGNSTSSSMYNNFYFDGYSTIPSLNSDYKYIIGSNADIYDYSGTLVRAGDYETLCSYFKNGLSGSFDKTEKPTKPTTSGDSSGVSSVDLSGISDYLSSISHLMGDLIEAIGSLKNGSFKLDDDFKNVFDSILTQVTNILTSNETFFTDFQREVDTIELYLSEIKNNFLEFISIGGDIKKLADFFSEVNVSFSNICHILDNNLSDISNFLSDIKDNTLSIRMGIDDLKSRIPSDFDSIIKSMKDNIVLIRLGIDNLNSKIPSDFANVMGVIKDSVTTIKIKIDSVVDSISDLSGKLSSIDSFASSISYNTYWNNENLRNFSDKFIDFGNAFFNHMRVIEEDFLFLNDTISNIDKLLRLKELHEYLIKVGDAVISLPEDLKNVLKELFIPKEDHFSEFDDLKKHFGFVRQITEMGDILVNQGSFDSVPLDYTFEVNHSLFGHFSFDIDFSVIPVKYVEFIRNFIRGAVLIVFVRRTRKRLPKVISGIGGV